MHCMSCHVRNDEMLIWCECRYVFVAAHAAHGLWIWVTKLEVEVVCSMWCVVRVWVVEGVADPWFVVWECCFQVGGW